MSHYTLTYYFQNQRVYVYKIYKFYSNTVTTTSFLITKIYAQTPSHHLSPGGESRGKRKHQTIFLERTREYSRLSDEHWNCLKGDVEETSERDGVVRIWAFPSSEMPSCTKLN